MNLYQGWNMTSELSPLGSVPFGWRLVKIKDISIKVGSGATPRGGGEVYLPYQERFALIRSQNVFDRYFDDEGLAFITEEHALELQGASG
jgi:type I restriction enzyme, S subunit